MDQAKKNSSEIDMKLDKIKGTFDVSYVKWLTEKQRESSSRGSRNKSNNGDSSAATPAGSDNTSKGKRSKTSQVETRSEPPEQPSLNFENDFWFLMELDRSGELKRKMGETTLCQDLDAFSDVKAVKQPIRGFVNESLFLKNFLMKRKGCEEFKALAIVGKFGVGKTTLCQDVINDKDVKEAYLPRVWVSMYIKEPKQGEDPKVAVLKRMLRSLGVEDGVLEHIKTEAEEEKRSKVEAEERDEETAEKKEICKLLQALNSNLFGKKYLVVLDDVWEDNKWDQRLDDEKTQQEKTHLSCGFPKGFGGRVIVTSRDEGLAKKIVGEEENVQRLFPRSDVESVWEIYKDAYGKPLKYENVKPIKDVSEEPTKDVFLKVVRNEDDTTQRKVVELNPRYPGRYKKELMDKSGGVPWAARMLAKMEPLKNDDEDKDL